MKAMHYQETYLRDRAWVLSVSPILKRSAIEGAAKGPDNARSSVGRTPGREDRLYNRRWRAGIMTQQNIDFSHNITQRDSAGAFPLRTIVQRTRGNRQWPDHAMTRVR